MIIVWVDGLAMPANPGTGTYGYVVYRDGRKILEGHGFAGERATNNYAEYEALLRALKSLLPFSGEEITVKSDSKLLVNQMRGEWKVKKGIYLSKYRDSRDLAKKFKSISFIWVPREENTEADELSRLAYSEHTASFRR